MRVLMPWHAEEFETVVPLDNVDFDVFDDFDGRRHARDWVPIQVERVRETERGKPLRESDFPWLKSGVLVLNQRAAERLGPELASHVELLPLKCDVPLWVLNVTTVVDVLDEERSKLVRFDSGRIMRVEQFVFRGDAIGDLPIFKVPQLARSSIMVTDRFVGLVERFGLNGLEFELVWEAC
jgi:hypothetical protein